MTCLWLVACAPADQPTPFIPPTRASNPTAGATAFSLWTATPAPAANLPGEASPLPGWTSTPILPSPTPPCESNLKWLADLTIPDSSVVAGGLRLDKQWQVQNSGTCDWDSRYRLKLVGGYPALGAPIEQALYPARAGATVIIQVYFIAPVEPGLYRSAWQAYDASGSPFGDTIFLEIVVP